MWKNLARKVSGWLLPADREPLDRYRDQLARIRAREAELVPASDDVVRAAARGSLEDCFAAAAVAASRVLNLKPFDVQILGALAMAGGSIAEMQTGEGKTLAATLPVVWFASQGRPVHVLTVNDYLAARDAEWMGGIYRFLSFRAGYVTQAMSADQRRQAYDCDVTYATPNEAAFDYLRDCLALDPADMVHRDFAVALIDEADSILIDEARIPLVIAGGQAPPRELVRGIAQLVRTLIPWQDYIVQEHSRDVQLTDSGVERVEAALNCSNLYEERNIGLFTAVADALHAAVLLRRDIDYIIRDGVIEIVDEFKGRVAQLRRWPAGLQTALEAKEGLDLRTQGRILGSITLQSFVGLYQSVCGMTGTAITQAEEFRQVYRLDVVPIPTNRPVIRIDQPDRIFPHEWQRTRALVEEIARARQSGRPVLVGTANIAASEQLSSALQAAGIPHHVLNARNDAVEAGIIARAGVSRAVTISTNMAGRGTDIRLAEGVAGLGGLYVIGTARHESRRIDLQLRGRAGRQGDPGESRFFLSMDDDLMRRFGLARILPGCADAGQAMEIVQRIIEGENLSTRLMLRKYDQLIEQQRRWVQTVRLEVLDGERHSPDSRAALLKIDELWSDYLAAIGELKSGIHWISFGGKNPLDTFLREAQSIFSQVEQEIIESIEDGAAANPPESLLRGATWTYLITDQPLGDWNQRLARGIANKIRLFFER